MYVVQAVIVDFIIPYTQHFYQKITYFLPRILLLFWEDNYIKQCELKYWFKQIQNSVDGYLHNL